MCARVPILTLDELREVVASISVDTALVQLPDWPLGVWPKERTQAFPGSRVHVIVPEASDLVADAQGFAARNESAAARAQDPTGPQASQALAPNLTTALMTWGVEAPWQPGKLVFNTRLESALRDYARGKGMWNRALSDARCIVATAGFFEPHATERVKSARSGKLIKRSYLFGAPTGVPLLLGGLVLNGCFTVVTTEPNAYVSPVHNRMPLVLSPAEARQWLWGPADALGEFAERENIDLEVRPEDEQARVVDEAHAQADDDGTRDEGGSLTGGQMSLF